MEYPKAAANHWKPIFHLFLDEQAENFRSGKLTSRLNETQKCKTDEETPLFTPPRLRKVRDPATPGAPKKKHSKEAVEKRTHAGYKACFILEDEAYSSGDELGIVGDGLLFSSRLKAALRADV